MRHKMAGRKLGRTTSHREAMFRNQLLSLVRHERIITTLPKAKELRPLAERCVTHGKQDTVSARRWVFRWVQDRDLVGKLFNNIAPRFKERPGGYLRIVKLGPRQGDGAEMAVLEFVDFELNKAPASDGTEAGGVSDKPAKSARAAAAKAKPKKADRAAGKEGKPPSAPKKSVRAPRKAG